VLERWDGASLVEVALATGRPHQIRIHLASYGHPLLGDPLYAMGGGLLGEGRAVPGDLGYLLHAMALRVVHPRTGQRLDLYCRPPRPLRTAEGA
jgi:23S rRNA pseudouridine1911/1915/1917 synthase